MTKREFGDFVSSPLGNFLNRAKKVSRLHKKSESRIVSLERKLKASSPLLFFASTLLLGYSLAMINGEVIGIIGMHIGLGIWVCIYPNTPLQYVVQLLSHARIDLLIATL